MNRATKFIRGLPEWLETLIVMLICFGLFTATSVYSFISGQAFEKIEIDNHRMVELLIFEFVLSAIALLFLWARGYKIWEKITFRPTVKSTLLAPVIFLADYILYAALFIAIFMIVGERNLRIADISINVSFALALAVSLINPLFEEAFVVGYIFDKLSSKSLWLIVLISVSIRTSYHLYQGWLGLISLIPIGIILALVYYRTKNLWPIYLVHVIVDLIGLSVHR